MILWKTECPMIKRNQPLKKLKATTNHNTLKPRSNFIIEEVDEALSILHDVKLI